MSKALSARKAIIIYASMVAVIAIIGAIIIAIVVSSSRPQIWKGVQPYFGYGSATESYTVANNWRISWECTLASSAKRPFIIDVYSNQNALLYSRIVSEYCGSDITKGVTTTLPQGGDVSIVVTTDPAVEWTFNIEQLE